MQINTEYYRSPQEDFTGYYGLKKFVRTYKELLNEGDLPFNEQWDPTISPWGMSKTAGTGAHYDNDLVNKCWLFPDIENWNETSDYTALKRYMLYKESPVYNFLFIMGGKNNAFPAFGFAEWSTRNGYNQTAPIGGTIKTDDTICTSYHYERLVWLVQCYVCTYGENNASLTESNISAGGWTALEDIGDDVWSDILSGQKSIAAIRFIPCYAYIENYPDNHATFTNTQYRALAEYEPLPRSKFGENAPYTEEYIDYMINSLAGVSSLNDDGGVTTISLGTPIDNFLCKYRVDWSWVFYADSAAWCADYFNINTVYKKFGTWSKYWKRQIINYNNGQYMYYRQLIDTAELDTKEKIIDYVCTQAAYLGGYFVTKSGAQNTPTNFNNPDMYLGIIESDGITKGRYVKGAAIQDEPQSKWTGDPWIISPYDPEIPVDPNTYDDNTTVLNNVRVEPQFFTKYILTTGQLAHAQNFLCNAVAENADSDFWSTQKLYTNNPIDVVQSLMFFPFDITNFQTIGESSYKTLAFGQLIDNDPEPYTVEYNRENFVTIDMGECIYYPTFGNSVEDFRNYPPYSSALLYIPYCGSVEIDPNLYMGQKIKVKIIADMTTGSCLALIYRNNMVVDSISGTIGFSVPLSGLQSQTLANAERQAETALKQARISAVTTLANSILKLKGGESAGAIQGAKMGGGVGAAVGAAVGKAGALISSVPQVLNAYQDIKNAQYDLEHINVPYKTIGTATAMTSFANERRCRLIIRRPVMLEYNQSDYAHSSGYACLKIGKVSDFKGYAEFQSVDLSGITATATEKEMIFKLMQGGVFL